MKRLYTTLALFIIISASVFSQNIYYVNDGSTTGDVFCFNPTGTATGSDSNPGTREAPFATLNKAISVAITPGSIIYVDAGTYTPTAGGEVINKSLTIRGANYLISPNDATDPLLPNGSRVAETIIMNNSLVIGASNINIEGMTFDPLTNFAIKQTDNTKDYDNVNISKNIFRNKSDNRSIQITGKNVLALVTFNCFITDNRFIKDVSTNNTAIVIAGINNVQILNNTFTVSTNDANRVQVGINLGPLRTDNVIISQNIAYRQNNLVSGITALNARIDFNKVIECNRFVNYSNNLNDPSIVDISDNIVTDPKGGAPSIAYQKNDGTNISSPNIARIERNIVALNGTGLTLSIPQALISADLNNGTQNSQVYIRDNKLSITGDFSSLNNPSVFIAGILFSNNSRQAVVERNEIEFTATNYNATNKNGIYISHSGLQPGTNFNILNNMVSGFTNSVAIQNLSNGNFGELPNGVVVNINNNSFTNDVMSINNGTLSQTVNGSCNWFGSALVATVSSKISSTVAQSPWLTEGSDNNSVVGFQNSGTCTAANNYFVNDNSQSGDVFTTAIGNDANGGTFNAPFATLFNAISQATPGSTIYVDAGTYNPPFSLSINKPLTILGPNHNISPLDATRMNYNEDRNEEAFINGVFIGLAADNITIKGLVFDPGAKVQLSKGDNGVSLSNVNIAKNGFLSTSNHGLINLVGKTSDVQASTNINIDDNVFVKVSGTTGQSVTINGFTGVNIINNSFLNDETATDLQHAIHLGAGSKVNNIVIKGNMIDRPFNALFTNFIGNILIDSNKVQSSFQGWSFANNSPEPSIVTVSRNHFYIDRQSVNVSISRSNATNNTSVNQINFIDNTFDFNVDGFTTVTGLGLVYAQCNFSNTVPVNYTATNNRINVFGDLGAFTGLIRGLRCNGKFNAVTIENNELNFTATNFNAASYSYGVFLNLNTGGGNVPPSGSTIHVLNNKISGFSRSVQFFGGTLPGVSCNIHNNSLINNRDLAIVNGNHISPAMNATCNWYGFANAQSIAAKIFSSTPGAVTYSPWLTNGTDNEPLTPGFQPVSGTCNGTPPVITLNAANDITCFGANNGSIDITISGGSEPYIIAWTKEEDENFSSSVEDLTNLAPGTYDLTVTDANGSVVTLEVFINEPLLLEASAGGTNNLCFGESNGTASVLATGGTEPYAYLWSNGETTDEIDNLIAGNYSITVTDANGCTAVTNYTVTEPTLLTSVATGVSTSCANSASVVASGGTSPYSYSWSNGATTQFISSIAAGTYSVTITDAHGCQTTAGTSVTANEAFNPSASVTDVTCYGLSNGSITVTNVNATAPFEFSIDGVNFSPGTLPYTFSNLTAGTYNVSVKDANGCVGFVSKSIVQPAQMIVNYSVTSACSGQNNGAVNVTVNGGSPAYNYAWTGTGGFTSSQLNINGLAAGNYSLTVTDNKGCAVAINPVVNSLNAINVNAIVTNVTCNGNANGSVVLNASGGTGSFSYYWLPAGPATNSISNLAPGKYLVDITDNGSGCKIRKEYFITQPDVLKFTLEKSVSVSGCNTLGSVTVSSITGGNSPYQYSMNGVDFYLVSSVPFTINNLAKGDYSLTIKDDKGCILTKPVSIGDTGSDEYEKCVPGKQNNNNKNNACTITTGTPILARIGTAGDVDWFKVSITNAGNYTITLSHPSASIIYAISAAAGTPAPVLAGNTATLGIGTYYITVSGATVSDLSLTCYQLSVSTSSPLKSTGTNMQMEVVNKTISKDIFDVKVSGNPSHTSFILNVISSSDENISLKIMDISGRLIENRSNLSVGKTLQVGDRYIKGIYLAEIIQGRKRKVVKLVKL